MEALSYKSSTGKYFAWKYFVQASQYTVAVGSALCKFFCALQSSIWRCFVQALQYKVVLGDACAASIVVQSSTGRYFVQAL